MGGSVCPVTEELGYRIAVVVSPRRSRSHAPAAPFAQPGLQAHVPVPTGGVVVARGRGVEREEDTQRPASEQSRSVLQPPAGLRLAIASAAASAAVPPTVMATPNQRYVTVGCVARPAMTHSATMHSTSGRPALWLCSIGLLIAVAPVCVKTALYSCTRSLAGGGYV